MGGFGKVSKTQTTHLFLIGEKVCPAALDVNVAEDKIAFNMVSCEQPDLSGANTAHIVFQFPNGELAKANSAEVEDTIGQVLAAVPENENRGQSAAQSQQSDQSSEQPSSAPARWPTSIEMGQTPQQVEAALGKPEKIVNLGAKMIYVYKDLKVTFVNGKVSDVQ